MKKWMGLILVLAMLVLTACGGENSGANVSAEEQDSHEELHQDMHDEQHQDEHDEQHEAVSDDISEPETEEETEDDDAAVPDADKEEEVIIVASHSDVTFKTAGSNFALKASPVPQNVESVTYVSEDESVAVVAEDGTVTAVAPGRTNVKMTLTFTDGSTAEFSCIIRCNWTMENEKTETCPEGVDLAAFFSSYMTDLTETIGAENMPAVMAVEGELLDAFYAGLNGIATRQCVVQMPGIGAVVFEFALVEVENESDVDAVKEILQNRVNYQVDGGAWYPETIEGWEKAEIIVNGKYIALIAAGELQDDAVAAYNALFD